MKLAILSHTEHCLREGAWHGLVSTVREIDHVSQHFAQVAHAACAYEQVEGAQLQPYTAGNVRFIPLRPSGGRRLRDKLGILANAPGNLRTILKVVAESDVVQLRLPTGMGMYLLPALRNAGRPIWAKYAGNWKQVHPPWSYALQRWWLRRQFDGPVTINGAWPGMESHILAFENPCISERELAQARALSEARPAQVPVRFCFVGRLESAKGVPRILQALAKLPEKQRVESVHFVGEGPERKAWERQAAQTGIQCVFHGTLDREALARVYASAHYLLLPSDSEGFPKVVAEAAAFGVIPVVSAVSAIPQYITGENGFLWPVTEPFSEWFSSREFFNLERMRSMSAEITKLAGLFTYERYCARLQSEVLVRLGLCSDPVCSP